MQHPSQPLGPTSHMGGGIPGTHLSLPPPHSYVDENMNIYTLTHVYVKHTRIHAFKHKHTHIEVHTHTESYYMIHSHMLQRGYH